MKIHSIQIGKPKPIQLLTGETTSTGIFKEPTTDRVRIIQSGLENDFQADLTVHGGEYKAVYAYGLEPYDWWRKNTKYKNVSPGFFGENLTVEYWEEDEIYAGDIFSVGSATLLAIQPRQPCSKLAAKAKDISIIKTFHESGFWGVYFKVLGDGEISPGMEFKKSKEHPAKISMKELFSICYEEFSDQDRLRSAFELDLPTGWKRRIEKKMVHPN